VLEYLVTSRARRLLLRALFLDDARGSVSRLARESRLSFAAAHRELEAMRAAGLATCERAGNNLVYRADDGHPGAAALREFLTALTRLPNAGARRDAELRGWLREAGAPLAARVPGGDRVALEELLASALVLAHRDATVARVLPLVFWLQRDRLDPDKLARAATRRNERHALGFFLELAGRLGREPSLARLAGKLRDRRRRHPHAFFSRATGRMAVASARRNSPPLARKWGFLMNLGLDSFASAFSRHRGPEAA
jgi:hypothetical protein